MASSNGNRVPRSPQVMTADIDWGIVATTETITIGNLPAGAYFQSLDVTVITAFDSGVGEGMMIGTGEHGGIPAVPGSIEGSIDLTVAGIVSITYGTDPLTVIDPDYNVPITVMHGCGGAPSTQGKARIALTFIQP